MTTNAPLNPLHLQDIRWYTASSIMLIAFTILGLCLIASRHHCPTINTYEVRGQSLGESVPNGTTVSVSAPSCEGIKHGALVVFNTTADQKAPVIKRAVAIPGDTFSVSDDGSITVGGAQATTADGSLYRLSSHGIAMIRLYENDYHGIIPSGSYLLLGDIPQGALDSSRLGLISASMITGVVTSVKK